MGAQQIHLTPIEFQLLRYLMTRADRPVKKEVLFREVWGYDLVGGTNLVEVAMRRLREKIEVNPSQPDYLITVRGAGYKFQSEPAKAVEGEGKSEAYGDENDNSDNSNNDSDGIG